MKTENKLKIILIILSILFCYFFLIALNYEKPNRELKLLNSTLPCEYQINDYDGRIVSVGCRDECGCHVIKEINCVGDMSNCLNPIIEEIKK